jgi:hypothetical protein
MNCPICFNKYAAPPMQYGMLFFVISLAVLLFAFSIFFIFILFFFSTDTYLACSCCSFPFSQWRLWSSSLRKLPQNCSKRKTGRMSILQVRRFDSNARHCLFPWEYRDNETQMPKFTRWLWMVRYFAIIAFFLLNVSFAITDLYFLLFWFFISDLHVNLLGTLYDLTSHLNRAYECPAALFNCPTCNLPFKNSELEQHILHDCAKRLTACKYCSANIVFDTLGMTWLMGLEIFFFSVLSADVTHCIFILCSVALFWLFLHLIVLCFICSVVVWV